LRQSSDNFEDFVDNFVAQSYPVNTKSSQSDGWPIETSE
jgi:hypothetical protein